MSSAYYIVSISNGQIGAIFNYNHTRNQELNWIIAPVLGEEFVALSGYLNSLEGQIIEQLNTSLTNCFNRQYNYTSYTELATLPRTEYELLFHYTSEHGFVLQFSYSVVINTDVPEHRNELWSVCKSNVANPNFRVNVALRDMLKYIMDLLGINICWLCVDFKNPFYDRAISLYLRCGFEIKYVSSQITNFSVDIYNRYLVMEAYNGKGIYATPPVEISPADVLALLQIANNIKSVESDSMTQNNILLKPSGWRLLFQKVISKNTECAGIINVDINAQGQQIISANNILVGCEGEICATSQLFPYEVNFHTHPIACYIHYYGDNTTVSPPSNTDLSTIFRQSEHRLQFHCIFALEGLYVVQVHPYWKRKLETLSDECIIIIGQLLANYNYTDEYLLDIQSALKALNNTLNPNSLIKTQLKISNDPAFIQSIREFKDSCLLQDVNRNVNLIMCSFVEYPLTQEIISTYSLASYMHIMKAFKLQLESGSLDAKKALIHQFLTTQLEDRDMIIPQYLFNQP
jgi:hypothetical protein